MPEPQKEPKLPDVLKGQVVEAFDRTKEKPKPVIDLSKYKQYVRTLPEAVISVAYVLYREKKEFTASDVLGRTRMFYWVRNADNLSYIRKILAILAKSGFLKRVRRGVYTLGVSVEEIKNMWPSQLAEKYYYSLVKNGGDAKEGKEKQETRRARKTEETDPYTLLLALKGKRPADSLPEPYRTLVEFIRKPATTLKKLPAFKRLLEDGIMEIEVRLKLKL